MGNDYRGCECTFSSGSKKKAFSLKVRTGLTAEDKNDIRILVGNRWKELPPEILPKSLRKKLLRKEKYGVRVGPRGKTVPALAKRGRIIPVSDKEVAEFYAKSQGYLLPPQKYKRKRRRVY